MNNKWNTSGDVFVVRSFVTIDSIENACSNKLEDLIVIERDEVVGVAKVEKEYDTKKDKYGRLFDPFCDVYEEFRMNFQVVGPTDIWNRAKHGDEYLSRDGLVSLTEFIDNLDENPVQNI